MYLLIKNSDRELPTKYLIEHIWGDDESVSEDTVWLYISYLKSKLECISSSVTIDGEKGGSKSIELFIKTNFVYNWSFLWEKDRLIN